MLARVSRSGLDMFRVCVAAVTSLLRACGWFATSSHVGICSSSILRAVLAQDARFEPGVRCARRPGVFACWPRKRILAEHYSARDGSKCLRRGPSPSAGPTFGASIIRDSYSGMQSGSQVSSSRHVTLIYLTRR